MNSVARLEQRVGVGMDISKRITDAMCRIRELFIIGPCDRCDFKRDRNLDAFGSIKNISVRIVIFVETVHRCKIARV